MPDILERILKAKHKYWTETGKQPNVVRMKIANYRDLRNATREPNPDTVMGMRIEKRAGEMECAFYYADTGYERRDAPDGTSGNNTIMTDRAYAELKSHVDARLIGIESREQVKSEVDALVGDNADVGKPSAMKRDFATPKLVSVPCLPVDKEQKSLLAQFFLKNSVESQRFRFEVRMPEICEAGAIFDGEKILWVKRFDQDFLMSAHTKIPIGCVKDVVTLVMDELKSDIAPPDIAPIIMKKEFGGSVDSLKIPMLKKLTQCESNQENAVPEVSFDDALKMEGDIGYYARSILHNLMRQIEIP